MYSIQRTSLSGCTNLVSNGEELKFPVMWRSKKIGDILKMSIGSTPPKKGDNYNGDIPWVTISNLTTKDIKHYTAKVRPSRTIKTLPPGSLVGSFKMSVGRFGFLSEPSATNEAIIAIPPDATKENLMFLYYALPGVFKKNATLNGQGVPLLNTETIKKLDVILPPFEEQTAIANILSDQEALVAHYNDLIALHEKRFAYLSDELLSGRLRLVKNLSSEIELVKNEEWQESTLNGDQCQFPVGWFIKALGNIAKTVTGHTPSTSNKTYWNENSGTPWFSTPDLRQNVKGYITNTSRYLTEQGAQVARVYPAKTLLVSCIATIGEVGLLPEDGAFNQQINGILPNAQIDTNYLRLWFIYKTSDFKRFAPTSVVSIINKSLFNTFEVIMPPLEEQTLIAKVLSEQEALIAEYKKLRDAEQKRFDWLSDALLSGTYRVKMEA